MRDGGAEPLLSAEQVYLFSCLGMIQLSTSCAYSQPLR